MTVTELILADLLYMTGLGMTMLFLFVKSRLSQRKTALIFAGTGLALMALEVGLTYAFSVDLVVRLYSVAVYLPSFTVAFLLSRYRGWRLLYQLLSAVLFCFLIQHIGGVVFYLSGQRTWVLWLTLLLLTPPTLWLLHRHLCPRVFRALEELRQGWAMICVWLMVYGLIVLFVFPGYVGIDWVTTVVKPMFSLLMVGFYCVLLLLFTSVRRETEARHHAQLTELSLSALRSRMEAVQTVEEAVRIERHDLRHRFRAIAELVAQGENQEALAFIGAAQTQLEERKPVHWCRPPVLDAVFSTYFSQAQRKDIQVDARIALAEPLPVEEAELAIVFSNALENAIHACMRLPEERRALRCRVISHPSLMFECSNPYAGEVRFDGDGLPVSPRPGHGIGSHSIAAFCRKHGASYHYTAENGQFTLRIIL